MASSFQGWGNSWAQTWDRVSNPNAMYGAATIRITATGLLTDSVIESNDGEAWAPPRRIRRKRENDEALLLAGLI